MGILIGGNQVFKPLDCSNWWVASEIFYGGWNQWTRSLKPLDAACQFFGPIHIQREKRWGYRSQLMIPCLGRTYVCSLLNKAGNWGSIMVDFRGAGSTEIVNYWLHNKHGLSTNTTWNQTYKTEGKPFTRTMTRISRLAVPIAVHGADRDEETIIVDGCQPPRCGVEWRQSDISIQHQIWTYPKRGILQNACFTWKRDKNLSHLGMGQYLLIQYHF